MSEFDDYISHYMQHSFQNMKADLIPRDYKLEEKINLISKIEFALETSVENTEKVFNSSGTINQNGVNQIDVKIGSDKYRIYFNAQCFRNMQKNNDWSYKLPTICQLLGFSQKDSPYFPIPLISLYMKYRRQALDAALDDLKYLAPAKNEITQEPIPIPIPFDQKGEMQEPIFRYCKSDMPIEAFAEIHVKYFFDRREKILFPVCRYASQPFLLFPSLKPQSLFNLPLLQRDVIIILTDSIELAGINQRVLDDAGVSDIVWVSWYGDDQAIPEVDWEPLKGRHVYYLLKEHSGLAGKTIYQRAQAVKEELDKVGPKDLNYISFLANGIHNEKPSLERCSFPVIYSPEEFQQAMEKKASSLPVSLNTFKNDLSRLAPSRQILMSPFIHERSVTLICGAPQAGKTWFALHLANAISHRKRAFEGWISAFSAPVLYLHGEECGDNSIAEKQGIMGPVIGLGKISVTPIDKNRLSDARSVESCINMFSSQYILNTPKLLVIDNLLSADASVLTAMAMTIRTLKQNGWTIIIVQGIDDAPVMVRRLNPDSIIKIKKEIGTTTGQLKMNAKVTSSFPGENEFSCILDFNATPPELKKIKFPNKKMADALKKPRGKLLDELKDWHKKGLSGPEIAKKMSLTLSMVKKLKAEARISIPRKRSRY